MLLIRFAQSRPVLWSSALFLTCVSAAACAHRVARRRLQRRLPPRWVRNHALIPWPVSVTLSDTDRFGLGKDLVIEVSPDQPQLERIGQELASLLRPALDVAIPVRPLSATAPNGAIRLESRQRR